MWTSLPWFIMAHFGHHLLTALPQPLLPSIRSEFNLSYGQSAVVTTSFALAGGGSQLPSGWLADRINPAILIAIVCLFMELKSYEFQMKPAQAKMAPAVQSGPPSAKATA